MTEGINHGAAGSAVNGNGIAVRYGRFVNCAVHCNPALPAIFADKLCCTVQFKLD